MKLLKYKKHLSALFASLILSFLFFPLSAAYASYYEISGTGTWSSFSLSTGTIYDNNKSWTFSFDLPDPFSSPTQNTSITTSTGTSVYSYSGPTTYGAANFQFNGEPSSQIELVNPPGSFTGSFGSLGPGTYDYSGGITFGTGTSSNTDGFFFNTCLSGCQTSPLQYAPDGIVITLGNGGGPILTSSGLSTFTNQSINLNLDNNLGVGSGSLLIGLESGQIPGTSSSTPSATPEPSTLGLSPYNAVNSVGQELKKPSIFPRMGVAQTTYSQQGGIDG